MRLNRSVAAGGLIALLTLGVFARVVGHDFLYYDDTDYVTENSRVLGGLNFSGLRWALTSFDKANWHPLTWISHQLDVSLFELRPGWHHLMSVVLHTISSVLLFVVLRGMTGALARSALVAALFAVHPLHVQSVAWIAERKDVLSGLFGMLTLGAYLHYARRPQRRRFYPVVALFALGLAAKPMLVTLPIVLLLIDYWPLGRISRLPPRRSDLLRILAEKLPLLALAAVSSVVTFAAQRSGSAVVSITEIPLAERVNNALFTCLRYIGKTVLPQGLSVFYPHPGADLPVWIGVASFGVLAAATALLLRGSRLRGYLLTGWLWYLITLLPVIGLVQVGMQAMADRYTYLPLIGLFILTVWGGADFATRRLPAVTSTAVSAVVLLALAAVAWRETGFWKDTMTLVEHSFVATPRNSVLLNLKGVSLMRAGRFDEAIAILREALTLNPGKSDLQYLVGIDLMRAGRLEEAIVALREAAEFHPDEADLHYNLASALARRGDTAAAAWHYQISLELMPDDAGAHVALGVLLSELGRTDAGIEHLRTALRLDPDNAVTHRELSLILERRGLPGEALDHARRAAELNPLEPQPQFRLGLLLARAGRLDEARASLLRVVALSPRRADALYNLGRIADLQGDPRHAVAFYRQSLAVDSASAATHVSLGAALMELGAPAEAAEHFRKALRIEPDSLEAQINLMRTQGAQPSPPGGR